MIALKIIALIQKPVMDWLLIVLKMDLKIQYRSYNIKNKKLHNKFIPKHLCLRCEEDILRVKKSTVLDLGTSL